MDLKIFSGDKPSKFEFINNLVIKLRRANYLILAGLIRSWPRGLTFLILLLISISIFISPETSKIIIWGKFGIAFIAFLNWLVDAYFLKKEWLLFLTHHSSGAPKGAP
jgi:hypothetical protein